ncbi:MULTISPECIES: DMT family transporter [Brevibacillus]|uniref:DMT family transporter n=1 Tax=Brevibacillus TaxID=55080 RepID=UPI00156B5C02|nr:MULTISPECIES: DMT family transporter [Brevibacillus]MBU8714575.1 EamA family transporter [Brevibacillus parabrevis]MDH6351199.1 drug/metabolite transporter (DMT)-like permease [Brevibacillus sp. 1238]MDR4998581.1 DMT family transporter [Brevibacillus parabrevis]MED2254714.1 DMT family transporter [Brevibacillus parabrevis]NRQ54274.1 DMT family transporter [Brevibacillus sp. HD1.4A]
MKDQHKAIGAALLNAMIVGLSFIFVKMALTSATPMDAMAHRFTIAFVAATIPVLFGWVRLSIKPRDILVILPLALLYPALFFGLQTFGLVYTTASEAGIIVATVPIFTMVMAAFFLGETSTWLQKFCTLLSVAGVVFIFAMKGAGVGMGSSLGTILILLSALSLAGYSVLAKKMTKAFHYIDVTYMVSVIGFLAFNALALIQHGANGTLSEFFLPLTHSSFIISVLYLGVLSSLVTSFMTNFALSKMEASKMSVFNNLSTLVTIAGGVVLLREQIAYYHLLGALMIILGVIGTNFLGKKKGTAVDTNGKLKSQSL